MKTAADTTFRIQMAITDSFYHLKWDRKEVERIIERAIEYARLDERRRVIIAERKQFYKAMGLK